MTVKYKVQVKPEHERIKQITDLQQAATKTVESWDIYEGKSEELKVITLPLDAPVYRMANGRTQTEQMAYIAEASALADFFSSNENNVSAQQAQHKILANFAKEGSGSITPIYDELSKVVQIEPILITRSGVVVNGNRRLAAMRELFAEGKHPHFASIQCAILPPLTPEQIDEVEDRLQMRAETKLPYTWINEALRIRKRIQGAGGIDAVVRVMRKSKGDIEKAISAIGLADIYLKDWKKSPNDYRLVEDGQQFFFDLPARLKNKDGSLREANMRMAWILFDSRGSLGGRIYDFNRVIGEKATDVLTRLSERVTDDTSEDDAPIAGTEDDLEIDFGPDTQTINDPYASLITVLDDESRRDEVTEEIKQVCQIVIDLGKAKKVGDSALVSIRDANTRLSEVDLSKADPKTYAGIEKQLSELINRAQNLATKVKALQAPKAEGEASS